MNPVTQQASGERSRVARCTSSQREWACVADMGAAAETIPDDVPVTTVVAHGHAAPEIVRCIEKGCYDFVVLGFEGHGPMKGAIAGVCKKVMRHCPVPVLVVHAPPE